jgi:hypothetical protein
MTPMFACPSFSATWVSFVLTFGAQPTIRTREPHGCYGNWGREPDASILWRDDRP